MGRPSETTTDSSHVNRFEPNSAQIRYLVALQDALANGGAVSDRALCPALKMSRQTLYEWRQSPAFRCWMAAEIGRMNEDEWQLVIQKHTQLALRGSVKSAEFLLKARLLAWKIAGGGVDDRMGDETPNYRVDVLVEQTPQGLRRKPEYAIGLLVPRPPALSDGES